MWPIDTGRLEDIFKAELAFLGNTGFTFDGTEVESSEALGNFVRLRWSSIPAQRALRITCFARPLQCSLGGITVDIVDLRPPPMEEDDCGTMDSLNIPSPKFGPLEGSIERELQSFAGLVRREVSGPFWPILSGEEWKAVHFNWGDWK